MATKPSGDIQRLSGRTNADYSGFGHLDYLTGDYRALASVATWVGEMGDLAEDSADAAAASLTAAQQITGGMYGIGSLPLELPRNTELGPMAFIGRTERLHLYPRTLSAATTLVPDDVGKLVLSNDYDATLPAGTAPGMGVGWIVAVKNTHGANSLTVDCDGGSDTIDGGASIAIAAGAWAIIVQTGASAFVSLAV